MYKILIISENTPEIISKNLMKCIKSERVKEELKEEEYDLIYIENKTEQIEKYILSDYMLLPEAMKKLTINNEISNTYINLQIVNKLVMDNIKIIEFEGYYERIVVSYILERMLCGETDINKICNKICKNISQKKETKKAIKKVICRSYAADSSLRKIKYKIFHKKIDRMFFDKLLKLIIKDIDNMENL